MKNLSEFNSTALEAFESVLILAKTDVGGDVGLGYPANFSGPCQGITRDNMSDQTQHDLTLD
jgi:hypothetical protein